MIFHKEYMNARIKFFKKFYFVVIEKEHEDELVNMLVDLNYSFNIYPINEKYSRIDGLGKKEVKVMEKWNQDERTLDKLIHEYSDDLEVSEFAGVTLTKDEFIFLVCEAKKVRDIRKINIMLMNQNNELRDLLKGDEYK